MSGLSIREGEWVVVCDGAKALEDGSAGGGHCSSQLR